MSPLANSYVEPHRIHAGETFLPLKVYVCSTCRLVQLPEAERPEAIFGDYAYFSSYSDSWLKHAADYCREVTERFGLGSSSRVVEIAGNDGYLLRNFVEAGIPCLNIEPAANVAEAARALKIPTEVRFFGAETAKSLVERGLQADLLIGNNVLAHVPCLNDFVAGLRIALKPGGVLTMEFPHLLRLMRENQFDTIYHEHYSYLSLLTVERVFAAHGLTLFDVEELNTHGGSLRIFAQHTGSSVHEIKDTVRALRCREVQAGLLDLETYDSFAEQVRESKRALLEFLIAAKRAGKRIVGYGAPAKGNTLLNYAGIGTDFLDYTVDRSPHKQGRLLPGTRIPIEAPERIAETRPDYVLILPWNLQDEIRRQMSHIRTWGGRFVVPIPRVEVLP
jgi:SAM-dependent methyltransferase